MSFLTKPDGVRLRYTDRGEGERTIVLVHGWKGSHRLWDPAVMRLAESFRVVAFDNRGMGESDKPSGPYDFDVLADDLEFVLAELGVEDATLVGWSMGCSISLQYLSRGGARASRLVLINGPIVLRATDDFPFGVPAEQLDGYLEGLAAGWPQAELDFVRESMKDPDGAFSQLSFAVAMQTPLEMAMRIVRAQAELDHRAGGRRAGGAGARASTAGSIPTTRKPWPNGSPTRRPTAATRSSRTAPTPRTRTRPTASPPWSARSPTSMRRTDP